MPLIRGGGNDAYRRTPTPQAASQRFDGIRADIDAEPRGTSNDNDEAMASR